MTPFPTPPRLRVADRGLREGMLLALMEGVDAIAPAKRRRRRRGGRKRNDKGSSGGAGT
jgi:exopolyphosphatase/pppGpp-phosphohydrolase